MLPRARTSSPVVLQRYRGRVEGHAKNAKRRPTLEFFPTDRHFPPRSPSAPGSKRRPTHESCPLDSPNRVDRTASWRHRSRVGRRWFEGGATPAKFQGQNGFLRPASGRIFPHSPPAAGRGWSDAKSAGRGWRDRSSRVGRRSVPPDSMSERQNFEDGTTNSSARP